ncbi:MAG: TrbC/VirB2 family protein [Alphaproteobacteria bacterium]|nr:TrbC/VirB2 family protein [Alphaproteobacteria bacterium]
MKKIFKTLFFVFALMLISTNVSMAEESIFSQITFKVTDTLLNLQKVVYIIGGFGLIAFAFAAIFGKISFRHLSYLSFSLFLVAAMGGFVRYITGDNRALSALVYIDHFANSGGGTTPEVPNSSGTTPNCNGDPNCEEDDDGDSYLNLDENTDCIILEEACMHGNIQACNYYNGCPNTIPEENPRTTPQNPRNDEPSYSCNVSGGSSCDEIEYAMSSNNCTTQQKINATKQYALHCNH